MAFPAGICRNFWGRLTLPCFLCLGHILFFQFQPLEAPDHYHCLVSGGAHWQVWPFKSTSGGRACTRPLTSEAKWSRSVAVCFGICIPAPYLSMSVLIKLARSPLALLLITPWWTSAAWWGGGGGGIVIEAPCCFHSRCSNNRAHNNSANSNLQPGHCALTFVCFGHFCIGRRLRCCLSERLI